MQLSEKDLSLRFKPNKLQYCFSPVNWKGAWIQWSNEEKWEGVSNPFVLLAMKKIGNM